MTRLAACAEICLAPINRIKATKHRVKRFIIDSCHVKAHTLSQHPSPTVDAGFSWRGQADPSRASAGAGRRILLDHIEKFNANAVPAKLLLDHLPAVRRQPASQLN